MSARTGKEYVDGLRDDRSVWLGGQRVTDVTGHPAFAGAVRSVAEIFDLQHAEPDTCLAPHPETGELVNVSHLVPRSTADLTRRHRGLRRIAEHSVGLLGRTPDYLNVTFAGFAGRADVWAREGNDDGAANLIAFQDELARRDLALTHTIIHPTVDKTLGDLAAAGGEIALHKVADTEHGIVVRGRGSSRRSRRSPTRSRCIPASRYRREPSATPWRSRSPWRRRASRCCAATASPRPAPASTTPSRRVSTSRTRSSSSTTSKFRASVCSSTASARSTTR